MTSRNARCDTANEPRFFTVRFAHPVYKVMRNRVRKTALNKSRFSSRCDTVLFFRTEIDVPISEPELYSGDKAVGQSAGAALKCPGSRKGSSCRSQNQRGKETVVEVDDGQTTGWGGCEHGIDAFSSDGVTAARKTVEDLATLKAAH